MKGVILAGGQGTRLSPLTKAINKHLLPVGQEPMIFNPVRQLVLAGIEEIMVITGGDSWAEVVRVLGDGQELHCRFTYRIQEKARGIAHALLLAEDFAAGHQVAVILGDNIATHSIRPYVEAFRRQKTGAKVLLKSVGDPQRYGVAILEEGRLISLEEKPAQPQSNFAVTGIYLYDGAVFSHIKACRPNDQQEWGITPVNNEYLKRGLLTYDILAGSWIDAGTFESYKYANDLLFGIENQIILSQKGGEGDNEGTL